MTASAQKTVLVVDDSPLMRRLITEVVEADPDLLVVDVAENGRVALQKVRQHQPDCILLDVEMPELSGLDTMRRLRLRSSAKIVILSHLGADGSRVRAQAFRLGAADVIDKPTGAVSTDLRTTRGSIIQQTLRRVLGLPAAPVSDEPLPADGALVAASVVAVHVPQLASLYERVEATTLVALFNEQLEIIDDVMRPTVGSSTPRSAARRWWRLAYRSAARTMPRARSPPRVICWTPWPGRARPGETPASQRSTMASPS